METSQVSVSHPKYFGSEDCPSHWPNAPWLKPPPGRRRDSGETRAAEKNKEDQRSPRSCSKNLKSSSPKNHFMHPVPSAIEKEPPIKPTRAHQGTDWRVETRPLRWSVIKTVPCLWINGKASGASNCSAVSLFWDKSRSWITGTEDPALSPNHPTAPQPGSQKNTSYHQCFFFSLWYPYFMS